MQVIDRIRIKSRNDSLNSEISGELENFLRQNSFLASFYQMKKIPNNQDLKKRFVVSALYEYIFFYNQNWFHDFGNRLQAIKMDTSYLEWLIVQQNEKGMEFLDEEFNTENFKFHAIGLVDHICEFSYPVEDFDHVLFKKLTQSLQFTAILFEKDWKVIYRSPLDQISLILYLWDGNYYIFYPKTNFGWNNIFDDVPRRVPTLRENQIKLGCLDVVDLPIHQLGITSWEKFTKLIEECPNCSLKPTKIDIEIINEKKINWFINRCFYCRGTEDLISVKNIDYSFCQSCIYKYKNFINEHINSIASKEGPNVKRLFLKIQNCIDKIAENYFKCGICRCDDIDKNDRYRHCFSFSGNRNICRQCVKNLIYQVGNLNEFSYKNWKDLLANPDDIKVILKDKEFLELFCINCMKELAGIENSGILGHENCLKKYCQECFNKIDIGNCSNCGNPLINIFYITPYERCNMCNNVFPKSALKDGKCYICEIDNRNYMQIDEESKPNEPSNSLYLNSTKRYESSSDKFDLQLEISKIERNFDFPLNCKPVDDNTIELSPKFPDSYEIYAGECLKFAIYFADRNVNAVKVTPIIGSSNIFHPNFSNEGNLSQTYIKEKLKGLDFLSLISLIFSVLFNPQESFVENATAYNKWKQLNDCYWKLARRYLMTSGLS